MLPTLTVTEFREALRTHVCPTCGAHRRRRGATGPLTRRACQVRCPLFALLPPLVHRLNHRDPLLCPTEDLVAAALRAAPRNTPSLRRNPDAVARLLTQTAHLRG